MKDIQSLERGIHILFQFTKDRPFLTTEEIAQGIDLPKSSVYRFLQTLRKLGLLEREQLTGRYHLGLRLLELEEVVHRAIDFESIAKPFLVRLGEFTHETIQLNILRGDHGICLYGIESPSAFRLAPEKGRIIPLHAGASGLSILAFMDPAEQERICAAPLQRFTPDTITDPDQLRQFLAEIRAQGYVMTTQQAYVGSLGIAVPVFGRDNRVIGSVSLSGPMQRIDTEQKIAFRDELMRAAKEITDKMAILER